MIFKSESQSRRSVGILMLVGVLVGVTVSGPVAAHTAPSPKVKWKVSSLSAGEAKKLSAVVSTNSPGKKTWSKRGTCKLTPRRKPKKVTMGVTGSCVLILKIAKTKNYSARTSRKTITLVVPTTTAPPVTTVAPTTTVVPATTVAPRLVSVSASDGVQITVAGMRPDTGVYSLQWVLQGSTFNTYQMARATSPSMNVPAGWFACNRTYTFRVFVMQADWQLADGHQTQNVTPHSTPFDVVMPACPTPATPLTCATGGVCVVGDTGPGGGIVFYVSATAFTSTGSTCNTNCRYLEVAPVTGTAAWTDVSRNWATNATTAVVGGDGTAIGTGYQNTLDIIAQVGNVAGSSAAVEANAYRGPNNKTDWFLPSRYELNQLCRYAWNLSVDNTATTCSGMGGLIRAGFSNDNYWSSSEVSDQEAMVQDFGNGVQFQPFKSNALKVRPVRAF